MTYSLDCKLHCNYVGGSYRTLTWTAAWPKWERGKMCSTVSCLQRPTVATTDVWPTYVVCVSGDAQSFMAIQHGGQYCLPPHLGRYTEREWARSYKVVETGNSGWAVTLSALSSLCTSSYPTNSPFIWSCSAQNSLTGPFWSWRVSINWNAVAIRFVSWTPYVFTRRRRVRRWNNAANDIVWPARPSQQAPRGEEGKGLLPRKVPLLCISFVHAYENEFNYYTIKQYNIYYSEIIIMCIYALLYRKQWILKRH